MQTKTKRRTRTRCKIDELPEDLKNTVLEMIADTKYRYMDISLFLKDRGFDISKSAVGEYARKVGRALQRLQEAQEQTRALIEAVRKNPESDYTDAGMQIMAGEMTKKFAMAEEEWDEMPLDKAGRLYVAIANALTSKEKLKADQQKKADIAFKEMKNKILEAVKNNKADAAELSRILAAAKEKMMKDDRPR